MSMATVVGLGWICLGLAALGLGRLIEGSLARGYSRKHPDGDLERYMRGQILYKRVFVAVLIAAGVGVCTYGLLGGEFKGSGKGAPADINTPAELIAIGVSCVIAGALMFLLRNRFARSTIEMFRSFKTDVTSESLSKFCSVGMGAFGIVVIVIGLAIGSRAF
jgi:hypothetical protein